MNLLIRTIAASLIIGLCSASLATAQAQSQMDSARSKIAQRQQCAEADQLNPSDQSGNNRQRAHTVVAACDQWLATVTDAVTQTYTEKLQNLEALVYALGYRDPGNQIYGRAAIFQALALEATNTIYFEAEAQRVIGLGKARDLLTTAKHMAAQAANGKVKEYRAMARSASTQIQEALDTWR